MRYATELDLPQLDPFDPATQRRLPELVAAWQTEGRWLVRTPLWFAVLDHDAVHDLFKDTRFRAVGATILELQGITSGKLHDHMLRTILALEGEAHTRLRRMLGYAFTPRAVDRLRPMMRDYLEERMAIVAPTGHCEAVGDITEAYPIAVICALAGAPREDWPRFSRWAESIFKMFSFNVVASQPEVEAAVDALEEYTAELIERRRRAPSDDLLSDLLAVEEDGDRLTTGELISVITTVLVGGTDTTRNQLALALLTFARHPEQWELLASDPSLATRAVEEILRFEPTANGTLRIAIDDVTYRDVTFPAGCVLTLMADAANRDPRAVANPHVFDITADRGTWKPLSFGLGRHYCLGANLARAELQEALTILPPRLPNLRLTREPEMSTMGLHGPTRLEIGYDPT